MKIPDQSQIIHIIAEAIVIISIVFYFSRNNKKLLGHIKDLVARVEDQEDMIHKQGQQIKQLLQTVQQIQDSMNSKVPSRPQTPALIEPTPQPMPTSISQPVQQPHPDIFSIGGLSGQTPSIFSILASSMGGMGVPTQQHQYPDKGVEESKVEEVLESEEDLDNELKEELAEIEQCQQVKEA